MANSEKAQLTLSTLRKNLFTILVSLSVESHHNWSIQNVDPECYMATSLAACVSDDLMIGTAHTCVFMLNSNKTITEILA